MRLQQLTTLDVSNNTALTWLWCYKNELKTLDISTNIALTELNCSFNELATLDVSTNTALTELYCHFNELTTLDVSHNAALTRLECYKNELKTLDVSNNAALQVLYCSNNYMVSPDDVIGWQEIGLVLNNTFFFYPQRDRPILYGDIDGDGEMTAADATLILRYIEKLEEFDDYQIEAANVFGVDNFTEEDITTAHATRILKYIVGFVDKLGP